MPIYEYICNDCKYEFEVKQRITDAPINTCPKCNGSVTRLISQAAFILKGRGWYKDGYSIKPGADTQANQKSCCDGCDQKKTCNPADGKAKEKS